jgi:hypothetical protein
MIPEKNDKEYLLDWVDEFAQRHSKMNINYWIGITNELIPGHKTWHLDKRIDKQTNPYKILWIITSRQNWEKYRSPPSLFEYLLATVFRCALESLSRELELEDDKLKNLRFLRHSGHKQVTRGCIFDFTHRRVSVSIFKLCYCCREKLSSLEESIKKKDPNNTIDFIDEVTTILSKKWMGRPTKRDSPLYDLKKIYKYDVDRNSGFNKGFWEKIRDSITDNLAQWTIGTLITGLIGIIITLIIKN